VSYEVTLRRAAQNGLDGASDQEYGRLAEVISALEENPRPSRVKKLARGGLWRVRVGQHRVVYAIDDEARVVTVVRVARRREDTYKGL